MTLRKFLLDRIGEDEAVARHVVHLPVIAPMPEHLAKKYHSHPFYGFTQPELEELYAATRGAVEPITLAAWSDAAMGADGELEGDFGDHSIRWWPGRVLAECEAKRRIVERHSHVTWERCVTLTLLALPYVDHPEFDPTWRSE